jgi:hypothetical protein
MLESDDYLFANSEATKMLAAGIERVANGTGATQRDIAKQLNYKTSVVLSHMALGRVPIPIDRVPDIARVLALNPSAFLLATLKQRHPDIDFDALLGVQMPSESALAAELEAIAGAALDELPSETRQILREVVGSRQPERRWLAHTELPIVELLRSRFPEIGPKGLSRSQREMLIACLENGAAASAE